MKELADTLRGLAALIRSYTESKQKGDTVTADRQHRRISHQLDTMMRFAQLGQEKERLGIMRGQQKLAREMAPFEQRQAAATARGTEVATEKAELELDTLTQISQLFEEHPDVTRARVESGTLGEDLAKLRERKRLGVPEEEVGVAREETRLAGATARVGRKTAEAREKAGMPLLTVRAEKEALISEEITSLLAADRARELIAAGEPEESAKSQALMQQLNVDKAVEEVKLLKAQIAKLDKDIGVDPILEEVARKYNTDPDLIKFHMYLKESGLDQVQMKLITEMRMIEQAIARLQNGEIGWEASLVRGIGGVETESNPQEAMETLKNHRKFLLRLMKKEGLDWDEEVRAGVFHDLPGLDSALEAAIGEAFGGPIEERGKKTEEPGAEQEPAPGELPEQIDVDRIIERARGGTQ